MLFRWWYRSVHLFNPELLPLDLEQTFMCIYLTYHQIPILLAKAHNDNMRIICGFWLLSIKMKGLNTLLLVHDLHNNTCSDLTLLWLKRNLMVPRNLQWLIFHLTHCHWYWTIDKDKKQNKTPSHIQQHTHKHTHTQQNTPFTSVISPWESVFSFVSSRLLQKHGITEVENLFPKLISMAHF